MNEDNGRRNEIMYFYLKQKSNKLNGEIKQLASHRSGVIEFKIEPKNQFIGKYRATVSEKCIKSKGEC